MVQAQFDVLFHNAYGGMPEDLGYAVTEADGVFTATKGSTAVKLEEDEGRILGWNVNGVRQPFKLQPRDQAAADARHADLVG